MLEQVQCTIIAVKILIPLEINHVQIRNCLLDNLCIPDDAFFVCFGQFGGEMTFEVEIRGSNENMQRFREFCKDHELEIERLDPKTVNVYHIPDHFCDEFTDYCDHAGLPNKLV